MNRRAWGLMASLGATAMIGLGGFMHSAGAADPTPPPSIKRIDATAFPTVSVDIFGGAADIRAADGVTPITDASAAIVGDAGVRSGVIFVVDTATTMAVDGRLDAVKASLTDIANNHPASVSLGLTTASTIGLVRSPLDSGPGFAAAVSAIEQGQRPESALRDAMQKAIDMFKQEPTLLRNIVLISASSDIVSGVPYESLRSQLLEAGITVVSVAIDNPSLDRGLLSNLAGDGKGAILDTVSSADVSARVATAYSLIQNERRVTVRMPDGSHTFDLQIGGVPVSVAPVPGSVTSGLSANPTIFTPEKTPGPSFLQTSNGKMIVVFLVGAAIVLFGAAIALLVVKGENRLDAVLQPYADGYWKAPEAGIAGDDESGSDMAQTKFMQRAVKITSKLAQRRGLIVWLEGALEKADLPVHPAEALLFYVTATGVLTALTGVATRNPVKMLMVLILMGALPPLILKFLGKRRKRVFQGQLADTLQLLAGSLKAGYSLMQGVAAVSEEIEGPMGKELRRVVIESRLGRPLEDSLNEAAERMESADFAWVVMAINIQREVGGNLAELLMSVADTMIQRERLRRDVKALTAEGRVSAVVIGILPIALGFAMFSINPTYVKVLFTDKLGRMLAVGSVLLAAVGFWWMKKTIEVEI